MAWFTKDDHLESKITVHSDHLKHQRLGILLADFLDRGMPSVGCLDVE